jgi:hypothetical protein
VQTTNGPGIFQFGSRAAAILAAESDELCEAAFKTGHFMIQSRLNYPLEFADDESDSGKGL